MLNNTLFIIPARGGSKGIPYKNIKEFCGQPLIHYSINLARKFVLDKHICVSTDDDKIIKAVNDANLEVPFVRPSHLASDTASTNDVLLHAINYYEEQGVFYERIVLLQPTSPLRQEFHLKEAIELYSPNIDMVVSVTTSDAASVLCKENEAGYLELLFNRGGGRRQDMQQMYQYNGAIYIINSETLKNNGLQNLCKRTKYIMSPQYSIDIDTLFDWDVAEVMYNKLITNHQ